MTLAVAPSSQQPLQGAGIERLCGVLVEASIQSPVPVGLSAEACHRNDHRIIQFLSLTHLSSDLVPVHARHGDVEKDDVWKKRRGDSQSRGAIVGHSYFMLGSRRL